MPIKDPVRISTQCEAQTDAAPRSTQQPAMSSNELSTIDNGKSSSASERPSTEPADSDALRRSSRERKVNWEVAQALISLTKKVYSR